MPNVDFRRRASDRAPGVAQAVPPLGMSAGGVNKALIGLGVAAVALLLAIVLLMTQK
jgi:hypothetical protein